MFNIYANINKIIKLYAISTKNYTTFPKIQLQLLQRNESTTYKTFHKPKFYCTSTTDEDKVLSLDENQINEITKGNEEQAHKLQVLLLETEILRQEGKSVPSPKGMKIDHWKELLSKETRSARRKYLQYLFKLEKTKENRQARKIQKRIEHEANTEEPEIEGPLRYDLGHNNMFLRFYESTMNHMFNGKLIQAMQFNQKIVIDCGYYENMTKRENSNCAKQLTLAFAENRVHDSPFDLHYCNLKKDSILENYFHKMVPTMYDEAFPINVHECSYKDMFPKENIIYLTPHCRNEMEDFDHDAVYIIGGIVDKVNNEPLSLAKAKREGFKMAKLPLDKYLMWGSGSGKSLTINQVLSIMLDQSFYKNWEYALRHVPKRKLLSDEEFREQSVSRAQNSYRRFDNFKNDRPRTVTEDLLMNNKKSSWRPKAGNEKNDYRLINLKNILNK